MTLNKIESRLRWLAGHFDGTWMGKQLPRSYHGNTQSLGVTVVDEQGRALDVTHLLLELADELALADLSLRDPDDHEY